MLQHLCLTPIHKHFKFKFSYHITKCVCDVCAVYVLCECMEGCGIHVYDVCACVVYMLGIFVWCVWMYIVCTVCVLCVHIQTKSLLLLKERLSHQWSTQQW
jgi:hypothetical protein